MLRDSEKVLQQRFEDITGLKDFTVELELVYDPDNFGEYFLEDSKLKLYTLREDGEIYSQHIIEREALHELAHHIQFKHTMYFRVESMVHDTVFSKQFAKLLDLYYNGEVPQDTLTYLKEGGYI